LVPFRLIIALRFPKGRSTVAIQTPEEDVIWAIESISIEGIQLDPAVTILVTMRGWVHAPKVALTLTNPPVYSSINWRVTG